MRDDLHPALAYLLLEAAPYFKNGRLFLQTYLPFWMANLVQRLVLLVVPLVAVLFPLFKTLPLLRSQFSPAETQAVTQRLNAIEHDIAVTRFPNDFADKVYTLRQHVEFVRAKLSH